MNDFRDVSDVLDKLCQIALRQPLPNKQLILMTDASFRMAGYAFRTEDDPKQFIKSALKTYTPEAYASKTFTVSQTTMSTYAYEFLAVCSDKFFVEHQNQS